MVNIFSFSRMFSQLPTLLNSRIKQYTIIINNIQRYLTKSKFYLYNYITGADYTTIFSYEKLDLDYLSLCFAITANHGIGGMQYVLCTKANICVQKFQSDRLDLSKSQNILVSIPIDEFIFWRLSKMVNINDQSMAVSLPSSLSKSQIWSRDGFKEWQSKEIFEQAPQSIKEYPQALGVTEVLSKKHSVDGLIGMNFLKRVRLAKPIGSLDIEIYDE